MKVHTQFKREPINAGLTFMVIYSCFCACFCTPTSAQKRERERWEGEERESAEGLGEWEGGRWGCLDPRGAARWLGPL